MQAVERAKRSYFQAGRKEISGRLLGTLQPRVVERGSSYSIELLSRARGTNGFYYLWTQDKGATNLFGRGITLPPTYFLTNRKPEVKQQARDLLEDWAVRELRNTIRQAFKTLRRDASKFRRGLK